jgi:L-alanine-DL-glutamate epimerase-like enolase superfamily enzyme
MKIRDIRLHALPDVPLAQPIAPAWAPGEMWVVNNPSFIEVLTDEGITGYGPAGGAGPATRLTIDERRLQSAVVPYLVGADPFAIEQHLVVLRNAGGCWGVEIALWDVIGKACGQPLYKLWGGYKDRVRAYSSCMEVRPGEQRAEDALARYEEGWRAIKLRIHDWDLKDDVRQVEKVREAVGGRMEVMVDANQAQSPGTVRPQSGPKWDRQRALDTARELQRLGVRWLEEPLDRYDWDGLARLCQAVEIPIAGGENNRGLHEFRWMIERDVYDIIQPDALIGVSITELRKVAVLAETHHKLVVPHHGMDGFGFLAHLHACAALPNTPYVEMFHEPPGYPTQVFQAALAEPLLPDGNGDILLPQRPGLGVEPRPELLKASRP